MRLVIIVMCFGVMACGQSKLENEYEAFAGTFEWVSTGAVKNIFYHQTIYPARTGYTADVEILKDGRIRFFKDNDLISENAFKIVDRMSNEFGGLELIIKLKGETGQLNVSDDRLKLFMSSDTALSIDRYPFPGIDHAGNYYTDYGSTSNNFRRQF